MTKVLLGLVAVLAGASLAVSIAALQRQPPAKDVVARHAAMDVDAALRTLRADLAKKSDPERERLATRVKKLLSCLPEIQGEINGLTPEVDAGSVYLTNTQQISSYCSPIIYGAPGAE